MNAFRHAILIGIAAAGVLSACSPERPWMMEKSTVNQNPIRLVESRHIVKTPLNSMSEAEIAESARIYRKNGAGPMYVVIAYKDHGKIGDSAIAQKKAAIETQLRGAGVAARDIVSSTVPLETPEPVALIAFDTLEAQGPAGCDVVMPGYKDNAEEDNMREYKTGCQVKTLMARQIATPTDLEGRAGLGGRTDGDHAADVVSGQYRPGVEPKDFLPSYVISELAGSGG